MYAHWVQCLVTVKARKGSQVLGLSVTNGCYSHHVGAGIELAKLLIIGQSSFQPLRESAESKGS